MSGWINFKFGCLPPANDIMIKAITADGSEHTDFVRNFNWSYPFDNKYVQKYLLPDGYAEIELPTPPRPTQQEFNQLQELQRRVDVWNKWRYENACRLLKDFYNLSTGILSIDQFVNLLADNADSVIEALQPYASEAKSGKR